MTDFEISILGGTGGPFENSTQCFIIRSTHNDESVRLICVDGGVGLGSIAAMLRLDPNKRIVESLYENEEEPVEKYVDSTVLSQTTRGFSLAVTRHLEGSIVQQTMKLYQNIGEYYITHPHMDHVAGMIMNSPAIYEPLVPSRKYIKGLPFTIGPLKDFIFNDIIWPQLSNKLLGRLDLVTLSSRESHNSLSIPEWNIIPFEVYHGSKVSDLSSQVSSSVYIITNTRTNNSIVVCGDLEKDHEDPNEPRLLCQLWSYLANNIPLKNLKAIVIECSNSLSIDERRLFGHLSSNKLLDELQTLRDKYGSSSGLRDLKIIVSHVKMTYSEKDPRLTILDELRTLAHEIPGLESLIFSIAVQGYTFTV
ncbi:similar to Saccharomyces cerevisiae YGL248W PDE1 Low-affinity cyclic AMP phosphodiesterase [Maudiozyma saulgeensis]|uniref:Similar to Saccharomyces cerevisiae YGL248W PDE1 Low-affinity cyclic AMP phosphodiesterase n=1 Tax=Maudiozyma saulgeensis TaxID=1789683 RepID=A0A1X7QXX1_9SACH|nr:similar to Saccharomyces cerevisiae YGL248W PDE1 Low-affinity cyclic AMP phosphodiesterase [Kazachstania saulgeensis]